MNKRIGTKAICNIVKTIIFGVFVFINAARTETLTMTWLNEDGTTYQTTTCAAGSDIILPATPTKIGYTFTGWKVVNQ